MTMWAKPGVKCVCIRWDAEDAQKSIWFDIAPLAVGSVYTIREFVQRAGGPALLLEEISNTVGDWFDFEMAYALERFRPVITSTQSEDLSIFLPLLETAGEDA